MNNEHDRAQGLLDRVPEHITRQVHASAYPNYNRYGPGFYALQHVPGDARGRGETFHIGFLPWSLIEYAFYHKHLLHDANPGGDAVLIVADSRCDAMACALSRGDDGRETATVAADPEPVDAASP